MESASARDGTWSTTEAHPVKPTSDVTSLKETIAQKNGRRETKGTQSGRKVTYTQHTIHYLSSKLSWLDPTKQTEPVQRRRKQVSGRAGLPGRPLSSGRACSSRVIGRGGHWAGRRLCQHTIISAARPRRSRALTAAPRGARRCRYM